MPARWARPGYPVDIGADEVAAAAGFDRAELAAANDRGAAMAAMSDGAARVVARLHADGRLDGILALGGSGGASLGSAAMRALPIGVPKLIVSTMAAGDTRPYVGESDIAMLHSVVDIAGINRISAPILGNAAAAIAGMAGAMTRRTQDPVEYGRPLIAATMFGVTTPCVTVARERLEALGYEVLVFHATGSGGRAMEALIRSGAIDGVLDVTTTELADEIGGGVLSAGPDRLDAAGAAGNPAGRLGRRARHDQLRSARDRPGTASVAHAPRPQRKRHADAYDARRERAARPADRSEGQRAEGPGQRVPPDRRRVDDRCARPTVPRSSGRRRPLRGAPGRPSSGHRMRRDARSTSTIRRSAWRWRIGSTSSWPRLREHGWPRPRPRTPRDRGRSPAAAARDGRGWRGRDRSGSRHRAVREVRRGRRRRPHHHLQLGPLPDGRPRLAGRPHAVR